MGRIRWFLSWVALLAAGSALAQSTTWPSAAALEGSGARFGQIVINVRPVFDPDIPGERTRLFRFANRLHIETQDRVVQAQLLFHSGDPFSQRLIEETERNLRQLRFLREPEISIIDVRGDEVDVEVRVRDTWSLEPTLEFGRSGGRNRTSIGFTDANFLGLGKRLELNYEQNRDRNSTIVSYSDPNLGFGRSQLHFEYQNSSDGHLASVAVERPFFELESRHAWGVSLLDRDSLERRYELGEEVDVYRQQLRNADFYYGYSSGLENGWVRRTRWGLRLEDAQFAIDPIGPTAAPPPPDRRLVYPYLQYEWIEDDYATIVNRDRIGRTEDEAYGQRWLLELGAASSGLGSDNNALIYRASYSNGYRLAPRHSLFVDANTSGRWESDQLSDARVGLGARYYLRYNPHHTLYAGLRVDLGHNLDPDRELLLGGDNGLRAYPIAFQSGEKSALLTLEHRYFTDWQPLKLFTVGAAAFVDVGRVWGPNSIGAEQLGTLKEFGVGLRLGHLRTSRANVIHIDLAWPLDDPFDSGPQLMVETRNSF